MAEPDGIMPGPIWPVDYQTGWVTWLHSNWRGYGLEETIPDATVELSLSVPFAVSSAKHTNVWGMPIPFPLVGGAPSGPFVVLNAAGVPCIEVPLGNDPDIEPTPVQIVAKLSWSNEKIRRTITAEHTLDSPMWLSGDVDELIGQPGVVSKTLWKQPLKASGPPIEAAVGDWVYYVDTAEIFEITKL